jgi:hypothetical protein
MFGLFKKKVKESETLSDQNQEYQFIWHEAGEGNPFNKPVTKVA